MTGFTEINQAVQAAFSGAPALGSRVERLRASATDLADRADSHGWPGVAGSMRRAVAALGTAMAELTELQRAGDAALARLNLITDQESVVQVSKHIAAAQQEMTDAVHRIDAVTAFLDVALQACARAGQKGLPASLSTLRDDVLATRGRLEQTGRACDAERRSIEAWLHENPDQGTANVTARPGSASDRSAPADAATNRAEPVSPEKKSVPATPLVTRDTFDQLLNPNDRTLLPREAENAGDSRLRSHEDRNVRRANDTTPEPPGGLTRRRRRLLALTATGTLIAQATIGAMLELGGSIGQAIGAAIFGIAALVVEGPEIAKTLRETRYRRSTKPGVRNRAHGK